MQQVGVRELKNDASEVIRAVREERAEYIVTYHGRPVAVILPIGSDQMVLDPGAVIAVSSNAPDVEAELDALRAEIAAKWQSDRSAVELLIEQRR